MPRAPGVDGRRLILDAAARLFYARGVDVVSVDEVAASAGVTKRAVYYHFPSKDELVRAWLLDAGPATFERLLAAAGSTRSSEGHPVGRLIDTFGRWMADPRFHGCAYLNTARDRPTDPAVMAIARDAKRHTLAWLAGIAADEGAPDPDLRARQYLMLVDALLATHHLYPPADLVRTAKATLAAILATGASAAPTAPARRGARR